MADNELRKPSQRPVKGSRFNFRRNALLVAQRELRNTASIFLDWSPAEKDGKRIIELLFTIKTTRQIAAEAVKEDQSAINHMSINEAVTTAWQLMKNYKLRSWQKDLIISDHTLLETFYRIDSELANGLRTNIKNPTAYLVKSLGIDQKKAPQKPKPGQVGQTRIPDSILSPGPVVRSGTAQSIAAIFCNIIMNEQS